jgi:hypothetical protein
MSKSKHEMVEDLLSPQDTLPVEMNYTNRFDELIIFRQTQPNIISMVHNDQYARHGGSMLCCTFIDPGGGPFIGIGQDMGVFHSDWKNKKVNAITRKHDNHDRVDLSIS